MRARVFMRSFSNPQNISRRAAVWEKGIGGGCVLSSPLVGSPGYLPLDPPSGTPLHLIKGKTNSSRYRSLILHAEVDFWIKPNKYSSKTKMLASYNETTKYMTSFLSLQNFTLSFRKSILLRSSEKVLLYS